MARVWEAPANANHGVAVFDGSTTPTDAVIEAATYATPLVTQANVTTRILIARVDLGDHTGDIRVRETGLPAGQVFLIGGNLFYPIHSDTLYDYFAHDVRVQGVRTFVLEEHELPEGHTEYRGDVAIDASGFDYNLETTDDDVQKVAQALDDFQVETDSTLAYDSSDNLGVNISNVVEHLQERIRYYTSASTYSDAGASVGQVYNTSPYRKIITKVECLFDPQLGSERYQIRLVELESNNEIKAKLHTSNTRTSLFGTEVRGFTFHNADGDLGVTIDGGIRLGILISRRDGDSDASAEAVHGSEAGNSPGETYDDASVDFELVNDVVYEHHDPAVGASTHSHGTSIRGNIKIFYTLIVDHGHFVGDGTVNADHIDSETAADGEVLTADGSGNAAWEGCYGRRWGRCHDRGLGHPRRHVDHHH